MKKYFIILGLALSLGTFNVAQAQQSRTHVVASGETLSAIAKEYKTTVGDIMRLNGMNAKSQLQIGKSIKIPAEGMHVVSSVNPEAAKTSALEAKYKGATHTVEAGESLYKISRKYDLPVDSLVKWNGIIDNVIKTGQVLQLSNTPGKASVTIEKETTQTTGDEKPNVSAAINEITAPNKNETVKVSSDTLISTTSIPNGGAFVNLFGADVEGKSLKLVTGQSGLFQSQSGWKNGKYYMQMNGVTPGTVVKLIYNGTVVYAKVLWNLSDVKDNSGLQFRISDAAAAVLGVDAKTKKFNLTVNYYE